jgi:hypothetical protein
MLHGSSPKLFKDVRLTRAYLDASSTGDYVSDGEVRVYEKGHAGRGAVAVFVGV